MKPATALRAALGAAVTLTALTACSGTTANTNAPSQPIPSLVDASPAPSNDPQPTSNETNTNTTPQPTNPSNADTERDKAIALAIRDKLQQAYNQLPTDASLDQPSYDRIYLPVWDSAERYGFSLTRRPIPYIDGFTLSDTQAVLPGHALMTELTSGLTSYCVASTDVLNPAILDPTQYEQAQTLPREFLLLDGSCQPHYEWVSTYIATMAPSAAPTTPSAAPTPTP